MTALKESGSFETPKEAKQNIIAVLDKVSVQLGNTRTVCKKYYVHPSLLELYENKKIDHWLNKTGTPVKEDAPALQAEEQVLMNILESL